MAPSRVPLNRALSKLGILSRTEATTAIRLGRVRVNGSVVVDPAMPVVPEQATVEVDGQPRTRDRWRTLLLHKPRAIITTRRDPEKRPTVFDLLGAEARSLVAVGRLDLATSGLLLLTTDTHLADWITDPAHNVPRIYVALVRGRMTPQEAAALESGIRTGGERLQAHRVTLDKTSGRESRVTIELREGKNREVRRLFEAVGHETVRLKRVNLGGLDLGDLPSGQWRDVSLAEVRRAFPGWDRL